MQTSKHQLGLVIGASMFAFLAASPASAQSFNCSNASNAAERAVCGSDRLSALDDRLSNLYDALRGAMTSEKQMQRLRAYQRQFLDTRDSCGRNTGCIKGAYLDQISVLSARLRRAETDGD